MRFALPGLLISLSHGNLGVEYHPLEKAKFGRVADATRLLMNDRFLAVA